MMLFVHLVVVLSYLSAVFGAATHLRRNSIHRRCHSPSAATTTLSSDGFLATGGDTTSPTTTVTQSTAASPTVTKTTSTETNADDDDTTSVAKTTSAKTSSTKEQEESSTSKPISSATTESKPSNTDIVSGADGWPFSNSAARVNSDFGISGGFKSSYVGEVPNGGAGLIAHYPAGSYAGSKPPGPGIAGFIFEAKGGVDIDNAKEAVVNYKVMFPDNFDFALAGKMPGFYGGDGDSVAKSCAGGHHDDRCWSARLMWREDGNGELYAYLPTANQHLSVCKGKCDVKYGASIGTGKWKFSPGKWTQVTERVKLNDVGKSNGEIEILVEGKSKVLVTGLQLRSSSQGRIRGLMIHTFFGGSSLTAYASPKDQKAFFKDFAVDITQNL